MADSRGGHRSLLFNPKFLMFCLYVTAYIALRLYGEIVLQQVRAPLANGGIGEFRMVSASPALPHWRQQVWRAVFSAAMVVEEEGEPVLGIARQLYSQRQHQQGGGDRRRIVDQAAETGRNLAPGQQYAQIQPQQAPRQSGRAPKATGRGNPNGLDEGERMIYDPRTAGR